MRLSDKQILLTGGTSGIGLDLLKQLESENEILVVGRCHEKLKQLCESYPSVNTLCCDLSQVDQVNCLCNEWVADDYVPDVIIFNAAVQNLPWLGDEALNASIIENEMMLNFTSVCLMIHHFLPQMKKAKKPTVLSFINSGLAISPKRDAAVYCASKAALLCLGRSLRYQLEGESVKLHQSILPLVDTAMTSGRGSAKISTDKAAREIINGIQKGIPEHYIGLSRMLNFIHSISPVLARKILKNK